MILNLTQHVATVEQDVTDLPTESRQRLTELLTFDEIPSKEEIQSRAHDIAELACYNGLGGEGDDPHPTDAMIGGAPWLMSALEKELLSRGINPMYSFSKRDSKEVVKPDGTVTKMAVFRHTGFVEVT